LISNIERNPNSLAIAPRTHAAIRAFAVAADMRAAVISARKFDPILTSFGDLRGKKLLDVCTGPGHLAGEAASRGALVDAIDFSEAMVREAKVRLKDINFIEADAEALPYDDLSFDAVACCFGLLHLPSPAQGVREAYRVLKPSGRYSVTLWCGPERGGELFKVILQTVSSIGDMNVDLPKAPPMFELSEPGKIEALMRDAGFVDIQRKPIASAWRSRRAEDIVEWIKYGTVRMSLAHPPSGIRSLRSCHQRNQFPLAL
jgi:ubiquinone/menaquinone biosynthesis C-methylase UbiE